MSAGLVLAETGDRLTRAEFDIPENIAFAIIAGLMLFSALKMVTTSNVVHAALYLVIVLAGVAALFILLGSDFVGATQILVYIGAIVVLFLFGIMLTRARLGDDETVESERRTMGTLVGLLLFVVMAFALIDGYENTEIVFSEPNRVEYVPQSHQIDDLPTPVVEALVIVGSSSDDVVIDAAAFSPLPPELQRRRPARAPAVHDPGTARLSPP